MGILISNATSSAITKYSVSLRSGEPDWSMIPSTGKSNKSQAETNSACDLLLFPVLGL